MRLAFVATLALAALAVAENAGVRAIVARHGALAHQRPGQQPHPRPAPVRSQTPMRGIIRRADRAPLDDADFHEFEEAFHGARAPRQCCGVSVG